MPRPPAHPGAPRRPERIERILGELADHGSVSVADLADRLQVSPATLRRDLALMEEQRLLSRHHGGAVAADVSYELPVRYRDGQHRDLKRAIALAAASLLPSGPQTVGFTGGTTTSAVARQLADRGELVVVTNALNIALDLALRPRVRLIVTGGAARSQSYELVGPWAEHVLRQVNIGTAYVGVDGITAAAGLTTHDDIEARTNNALIEKAGRVVVVADGSKIGRTTLAVMAPLADVDVLVTDGGADSAELGRIRAAGVQVVQV